MPFIPHSDADTQQMLDALNIKEIKDLYNEIPATIAQSNLAGIPEPLHELEITRLMQAREPDNKHLLNFIGAGAYEHYIPAAVETLISRGEFYTAYTPYQAEASQGTLQVVFEYQQMITRLLGMEVSNASLYDGASALAEAVLMAARIKRSKVTKILFAHSLHPAYQAVLTTIVSQQGITLCNVAMDEDGRVNKADYEAQLGDAAAVIISQPNFLGVLDEVDSLTRLAHERGALVIAQVNPLACALLAPPGEWGDTGADIACGEGQPLGVPLASGGPYFGFFATRKSLIRQMPGRLVGKTCDQNGKVGYTLTLQAREQHIRRAKATSNICTNQGLMTVMAAIYMRLLGGQGMQDMAKRCHERLVYFQQRVVKIPGVKLPMCGYHFNEVVITFEQQTVAHVMQQLRAAHIQAGFSLTQWYPELGESLLVCFTETKTTADIDCLLQALEKTLVDNKERV